VEEWEGDSIEPVPLFFADLRPSKHPFGKGICVAIAVIRVSQLQGQLRPGPGACRAATYKVKL